LQRIDQTRAPDGTGQRACHKRQEQRIS
jgi:hypothetical protein